MPAQLKAQKYNQQTDGETAGGWKQTNECNVTKETSQGV